MGFCGYLQANTAVDVLIGPFVDETDGKTAETGLTLSQADIKLSKNGQALAQKNDDTAAAHDANGYYNCELDATDTNTEGTLTLIVHESGALPVRHDFMVLSQAAWISLLTAKDTGYMDVNVKAVSEDTTAADTLELFAEALDQATGQLDAGSLHDDTITAASIATGAISADAIADNAIDAGALAADCITSAKIADNAIAAEHLAAGAIDFATFAADCKTGTGLKANVESISANAITATAIQNDAITAAKIANGAIDAATFAADVDAEAAAWIWNAAMASFGGAGTYGQAVEDTVADTNELQADWANGGRLDLIVDAILEDTGTTLDGIVDSILEDTAAMPTAAAIADAVWDEASTGHVDAGKAGAQLWTDLDAVLADTDEIQAELADGGRTDLLIDGIKAKTDSLTFTVAGNVDANIQRINDVALTGDGSATPWGPAA